MHLESLDEPILRSARAHLIMCMWPLVQAAHASSAQQTLEQQYLSTKLKSTDEYYAATLSLRSLHLQAFLGDEQPTSPPTMTSINEDRLLIVLGLTAQERNQIEGLASVHERFGLTEEQMSAHAVTLAVVDPPPTVGIMQRKTSARLLRSYRALLRLEVVPQSQTC